MKKRISHIISGLGTGGAERSLFNLLNGPLGTEFYHSVISLTSMGTYGKRIQELGLDVIALETKRAPWKITELRRLLKFQGPDLVQGWMYHGNLAASFARPSAANLVWNVRHGLDDFSSEALSTRLLIRGNAFISKHPDRILFNAEIARRQHVAAGFYDKNTQVIPNGFDVSLFRFDPRSRFDLRHSLGIPDTAIVMGQIGRFHPMKDHKTFLDAALPILKEKRDVHLLLAGHGVERQSEFFDNRIPPDLESQVHLVGEKKDVPMLLSALDVFVQSSRAESFPNILGEAMSVGRACIATNVGDSHLVLGDSGIIIPARDPEALNSAMLELIFSAELRILFGTRARKRIESAFTLENTVSEYRSIYSKLCSSHKI